MVIKLLLACSAGVKIEFDISPIFLIPFIQYVDLYLCIFLHSPPVIYL